MLPVKISATLLLFVIPLVAGVQIESGQGPPRLTYQISLDEATQQIVIEGQLENISRGKHRLAVQNTFGTSELDIIENIKFTSSTGGLRVKRSRQGDWIASVSGSDIQFQYTLSESAKYLSPLDRNVWSGTVPRISDDILFLSRYAFVVPKAFDEDVSVQLDWDIPAEWRVITPWDRDTDVTTIPNLFSLLNNYFIAHRNASSIAVHFLETEFVIVWTGDDNISQYPDAVQSIASVFRSAQRSLRVKKFDERIVLLIHDSAPEGSMSSATAGASSIQLTIPEQMDFGTLWELSGPRILQTVAHELVHTATYAHADLGSNLPIKRSDWKQDVCWLREGFAEYLSNTVLLDAQLTSLEGFVNRVTDYSRMGDEIGRSRLSLSDACDSFYHDRESMLFTYYEGSVLGFLLDMELRKISDGSKTLAGLLEFFIASNTKSSKGQAEFISAWRSYAPNSTIDIQGLITDKRGVSPLDKLRELSCVLQESARGEHHWTVNDTSELYRFFATAVN